jgi:hypothetical protein
MSGRNSRLNQLAARKQLLIVESELNRVQLAEAWRTLADEAHALAEQARTIRSMASAVATLMAGLSSCHHKKSVPAAEKPSWLQTILKGVGVVGTFWQTFRAPGCEQTNK